MSAHETERLSAYLDDELGPPARTEVEAHLARCAECREELAALAAVDGAARELPVRAPEGYLDGFAARVRQRIEAAPIRAARVGWRPPVWTWAVAAALVLAVLTPLTLNERGAAVPDRAPATAAAPQAVAVKAPAATTPRDKVEIAPLRRASAAAASERPAAAGGATAKTRVRQEEGFAADKRTLTVQRAAVADEAARNEAIAESKAVVSMDAAAAPPPAAVPAATASGPVTGGRAIDAGEAFRRLDRIQPAAIDDWRAQRERWRAFAATYAGSPQADEAQVRAIAAGLEVVRLGGSPDDLAAFLRDAHGYLAREDAPQKPRVRALLAAAGAMR